MYSLCFLSRVEASARAQDETPLGTVGRCNRTLGRRRLTKNLYILYDTAALKTSRQYGSFVLRLAAAGPRRGAIETGDPDMRDRDTRGPAPAAETHARVRGARGRRRATASAPSLASPGLRATMPREHLEARVTPAKASLRLTRITTG